MSAKTNVSHDYCLVAEAAATTLAAHLDRAPIVVVT